MPSTKEVGLKRQFLAALWRELKAQGILNRKVYEPAVLAQFESLIKENSVEQTDGAAKQHQEIGCLMLAAYRTLKTQVDDQNMLLKVLGAALRAPNSWIIRNSTRAMLLFSRDPMTTLVNYTKTRIPPMYGDVFEFSTEGSEEEQFTMRISTCWYHDFFVKNEAKELTPLFCAWDMNWTEAISAAKHGVIFQRETTLADGGDSCPFTFIRDSAGGRRR